MARSEGGGSATGNPKSETLEGGGGSAATVVAYFEYLPTIRNISLEIGEEVRVLPDEFSFIHVVHGVLCKLNETATVVVAELIDQGHIVFLGDTAMIDQIVAVVRGLICRIWIKIGIRRESVEIVSRALLRRAGLKLYLSMGRGGRICEDDVLHQAFIRWKTSQRSLRESVAGAGLCPPARVIKLELYDHQKQGLRWMIDREEEYDPELPPFWEEKDGVYRSELSSFLTLKRPHMIRGGILADQSGMGKTLTLLSLIAYAIPIHYYAAAAAEQHCMLTGCGEDDDATTSRHLKKKQKLDIEWRPTLVVCPPSVLATWKEQIEKCTWPGSLRVCTYNGKSKTRDPNLLRQYDLVLTTYNIVVREEEESDSPILNKIDWWRVVLDDVHVLKGFTSHATTPFINLKANRRWAVTGKPVQKNYNIFPIMAFLQVHPYCDQSDWELIASFQWVGRSDPWLRLKVLMGIFSLRRTMPPRSIQDYLVVLSKDEQDLYDSLEAGAKKGSRRCLRAAVLHLWQSCNSITLYRLSCAEMISSNNFQDLSAEPELLKKWVNLLQEQNDYSCPICLDQSVDTVITRCSHLFCKSCIMHLFERRKGCKSSCPMCRRLLKKPDIFCAQSEQFVVERMKSLTEQGSLSKAKMSSKVSALLSLLQKSRTEDPNRKSVVISQFRRMLMLLEGVLSEAGYNVRRMDAIDNAKTKTAKIVKEFSNDESSEVMLTTFKDLSKNTPGLNLSAASNVYLMEPCWNAHVEEEALSCIHRLGNKEDVNFIRFVCKNSIEERVLEMRKKKPAYATNNSKSRAEVALSKNYMEQLLCLGQYANIRIRLGS